MRITLEHFRVWIVCLCLPIASCISEGVENEDGDGDGSGTGGKRVNLSINVPRGSISTYATIDGTVDENHIDTIFVKLYEGGIFKEVQKFYGTSLQQVSSTNDSTVRVAFETESLSGTGAVAVEIFANRMEATPITGEIPLPDKDDPAAWFFMSGSGTLTGAGGAYTGEVSILRNVAKLRIRVSKHPAMLPQNLIIHYDKIEIQVLRVPDRTQPMAPPPVTAPSGLAYVDYAVHTGATLRPAAGSIGSFTGGQIDSLYLNENYLENESAYTDANRTQILVRVPTQVPGMPVKTSEQTYSLQNDGSYRIRRNYIYTLDISVVGQTLEPLITLDCQPWNDVAVNGNINGVYLNLDKTRVNLYSMNVSGTPAKIGYRTDNTSVSIDWSGVNPLHNIDDAVSHVQGTSGEISIFWKDASIGAPASDFVDTIYVVSRNVRTAVALVYSQTGTVGNWTGAFYRWNQRGERIIKMANEGDWTATVTSDEDFIVLDGTGSEDPNLNTPAAALGNDPDFEADYPVNSTATALTGKGVVFFRIGLKSALPNIGYTPRYGRITVTTTQGEHKIFVRQGEEADYVMLPDQARKYAVPFSPFNLNDPARGTGGDLIGAHSEMMYGEMAFNSRKFTDYPTQSGYMFQWNPGGGQQRKAFHPVNPISGISGWQTVAVAEWDRAYEPCPAGYRHPNDSLRSPSFSEIRQSLYLTPTSDAFITHQSQVAMENSAWGYYADGFFDRLPINQSPNGVDSTAVSFTRTNLADNGNVNVAYTGRLFYNPTTNAAIFLPAAGVRNGDSDGVLTRSGEAGAYWTESVSGTNAGWGFYFTQTACYSFGGAAQSSAVNVRCVKDDFGLPGSVDVN